MTKSDVDSFEWDEGKSDRNLRERGFDFEFASRVFDSDYIEDEDRRVNYGETRYVVVGMVDDAFITVVWTLRKDARRIIAAWPSSSKERRKYREHYS